MIEESLWITNRFGEKLEALLRKPDGEGPFPAVIFVSGIGMDLHEWIHSNDEISKRLVEQGFLTLQFSFAGCGKSQGDFRDMTIERQSMQLTDVIDWIVKRKDVVKDKIGIHATSFGATTCMITDLGKIKTLIFVSGGYYASRSLRYKFAKLGILNTTGESARKRSDGSIFTVGKDIWPSVDAFNPLALAEKIQKPIFVIHGSKDWGVETKEVKDIFKKIKSKRKRLKIFKGGDHGIMEVPRPMREEFLADVVQWFGKIL